MKQVDDNTPIIIGVGQVSESVPEDLTTASSHADLTAKAAQQALLDTGVENLAGEIDTVVGVRTFADSTPTWACPFGGSDNFPRSVANRIKAKPKNAIYEVIGGQSPQKLVGEFFEKLNRGDCELVLLAGGEVMANIKVASKKKVSLDWSESPGGELEDRGMNDGEHLITRLEFEHKLMQPTQFYGLMENARRGQQDLQDYSKEMAEEFSKLSEIAASNSLAVDQSYRSVDDLLTISDSNKMVVSPYPKGLVAKDGVNQAAALLLTTVGKAKALGIAEQQWVYLHGYADTKERVLLERNHIGQSKAMEQALLGALAAAGKAPEDIAHFDLYSCFPIVVSEAKDILGIEKNDPRKMSQTGGLAYFGGPGNNYTMHGIAELVGCLREHPDSFGLAYGNGGWMSKHSVGIYSSQASRWKTCDSVALQYTVDSDPKPEIDYEPNGEAIVEAYTINYFQGKPLNSVVIGRLKSSHKRFYAINPFFDGDTLAVAVTGDVVGRTIYVEADPKGNRYAFDQQQLKKFTPEHVTEFKPEYEYCQVEREGPILTVTINRPKARNALSPPANQELEGIFNAYEADKTLWVAIITGAGSESFSAGNDMKYMASGQEMWIPKTGFAGLTSRVNRTKPIIAAVNGLALGGGLEIAMACDMIVASNQALFGLPEVKVGLFAGAGGVQRLSRQIGIKKAMEMIITGEAINAEQALGLGLINYSVAAEEVLAKAKQLAESVCQVSPMSVRSSMQLHNQTDQFASTDSAVSYPHTVFDNLLNSEDFFEGTMAFAQKRKPRWTGR